MVINPTVTVSFSISVAIEVTVMKMEVVIPSTLVLVLVPPSLATTLPLPMAVVVMVGLSVDEVLVVWCLTGMTAKGESESDEEDEVGAVSLVVVVATMCDGAVVVAVIEYIVRASESVVELETDVDDDVCDFSVLVSTGSTVRLEVFSCEVAEDELVVEASSFFVVVVITELEEVEVAESEERVTVICFVEEGTVMVTTPALPPVVDDTVPSLEAVEEGVTVTRVVEEGTVTVVTPPLSFLSVEDLTAEKSEDEVCW